MTIITILLNALCQGGMGIISWIIVFIPFIFMSVIVVILLYVFGLDPATGKVKVECSNCPNCVICVDKYGNKSCIAGDQNGPMHYNHNCKYVYHMGNLL